MNLQVTYSGEVHSRGAVPRLQKDAIFPKFLCFTGFKSVTEVSSIEHLMSRWGQL